VRHLYRAGYSQPFVAALISFMDWTMGVPDEIAAAIDAQVETEEGEVVKQLRTKWEERVEAAATARGQEQGQQTIVFRQLERRFGPLSDALRVQLNNLPHDRVIALADALLDFTAREDLDRWLVEHAPQ
jgi:hypothetical protein